MKLLQIWVHFRIEYLTFEFVRCVFQSSAHGIAGARLAGLTLFKAWAFCADDVI